MLMVCFAAYSASAFIFRGGGPISAIVDYLASDSGNILTTDGGTELAPQ